MVSEAYLQTLPLAWEAYQRFVSVARRSKQATIATPYKSSICNPYGVTCIAFTCLTCPLGMFYMPFGHVTPCLWHGVRQVSMPSLQICDLLGWYARFVTHPCHAIAKRTHQRFVMAYVDPLPSQRDGKGWLT